MPTLRTLRLSTAIALTTALTGLAACGDDPASPGDQDPILATWNVTSFGTGEVDLIDDGMTLVITLGSDGMYTFQVTNDQADICGGVGGENCTTTGSFAHTATTVTINDDDPDDDTTFNYVVQGNTMTWTGTIGADPVVLTFTRVS